MDKIDTEFEKAKFLVTRNVIAFSTSGLLLLVIFNFFTNDNNLIPISLGFAISTITLILLLKTKKHVFPTTVALILGYFLNVSNLFSASTFSNFIDVFWMLNLSLFAFFTIGKKIGLTYLYINIFSLTLITIISKFDYIQLNPANEISLPHSINFAINILVCTTVFGYLLSQIFVQTERAKNEMTQINMELNKQYDEKSIMLKEIHHRVKNNLQVITSLLRLQLYKIDNEESAAPFNESIDRISSMALIHEKMYQGDKIKNIDLKEYIQDLAANLLLNYSNEKEIKLIVNSKIASIELNHIVPLSLIINELISNSIKHAFEEQENGQIEININSNSSTQLTLSYKDNGIWKTPKDTSSFGLELIDTFTEQLNGGFTFDSKKGADYCFYFKDIIIKN